ncbi:MAG: hypothetical protein WA484_01245 [Solirubrobacteraceae bacterium]
MTHESTWLERTRAMRRMRLTATLGVLLACVLLAGFASTASASTYDMRGEWTFAFTITGMSPTPASVTIEEMKPSGEFSGKIVLHGFIDFSGTITGALSGTEVSVATNVPTPGGTLTFHTTTAALESATNTVSGSGIYYDEGSEIGPGTMTGTRTASYQEILEREAREKREHEEALARENIRGEWALTLKYGPETTHGTALITEEANLKNEFASASALFEGIVPGTFSGTLEGEKATVTVTTEAYGPIPASKFTSNAMTITSGSESLSMSGAGIFAVPAAKLEAPGELTAIRTHTYAEVKQREAKEKQEREAEEAKKAKEAREAEEARAKQAREAQEKLEKEATLKQTVTSITPGGGNVVTLLAAEPTAKAFTAGGSGSLSLGLTNPNAFAVQGHLTLVAGGAGGAHKASAAKGKKKATVSFGTASFTISAHGSETVKIKLSRTARGDLTRHKALRVTLTLTTSATGMSSISKTYSLTLHASAPHHGKG